MFNKAVMFAPFPKETNGTGYPVSTTRPQQNETSENCCNGTVHENHETISNEEVKHLETSKDSKEAGAKTTATEVKPTQTGNKKRNNQKRNRKRKSRYQNKSDGNATNGVNNSPSNGSTDPVVADRNGYLGQGHPKGHQLGWDECKDDVLQGGPTINGTTEKKPENVESETGGKTQVPDSKTTDGTYAMSYVIANRSASLFFLHLYKECVADTDLAFKLGYPDELAYKLHERKAKCLGQLGQSQEAIECLQKATMCVADAKLDEKGKQNALFSLGKQIKQIKEGKEKIKEVKCEIKFTMNNAPKSVADRSPKFHCTTNAFKVAVSDDKGRHVVAGQDVAIAEMVTCEEPFSSILYPEYHTTHCNRYIHNKLFSTKFPRINTATINETCIIQNESMRLFLIKTVDQ